MNTTESEEITRMGSPPPMPKHPPVLPPPSPMAMPQQDLKVSATVRFLWRGMAVFGQTAQNLLSKCRRKVEITR